MGIYLKRYTQDKPPLGSQIDWGHPLSKGLVGCWLMNEGGGKQTINLVNNGIGKFVLGVNFINTIKGYGLDASGSNPAITLPESRAYYHSPRITIFTICKTDVTTANQNLITKWHAGQNRRDFLLGIGSLGSTWSFRTYSGAEVEAQSSTNFDTTNYHVLCANNDGSNINLYVDNILTAQTAFSGDLPQSATFNFFVTEQLTGDWNGQIILAYYWKRTLSPSEIRSLYESPYQFIKTPKNRIYSYLTPAVVTGQPRSYGYLF